MHVFAKSGYRLARTSLETKIAYSGFLLLLLPGIGTMAALSARVGLTPHAIATFYRGGDGEMNFPKEIGQLMETAHFHLFSVPVVLLVLTHLLFATGCPPRLRLVISGAAYLGAVLEVGSPFAVRYLSGDFAIAVLLGWILLTAGMLSSVLFALWALWVPQPSEETGP
jgi:hypothetical protein